MAGRRGDKTLHDLAPGEHRDDLIALHLARGGTRLEAAKAAKCSLRTVYHRLARPEFRALVRSYQQEFISTAYAELADGLRPLVRKLTRLMSDPDPKIQIAAGRTLGTLFVRLGQYHDLAGELAEIREAMKARGPG